MMLNVFIYLLYTIFMDFLPQLLVNMPVVSSNLAKMCEKTRVLSIPMRPHVKTVNDPVIANVLKSQGITRICVSNMAMFRQFLDAGWRDICLAIPCPLACIAELNQCLKTYDDLMITLYVDDMSQLLALQRVDGPFHINIEIDTGQYRTGVHWRHERQFISMIDTIKNSPHVFSGLTTHFGQLYDCDLADDISSEFSKLMMKVLQLKGHLSDHFSDDVFLAIGDTPSWTYNHYFEQINEIRAGNFLFNDLMIHQKGLCQWSDLACVVEAQVISKSADDCRFVLHCGSVHLSKEKLNHPSIQFGMVAVMEEGWIKAPLNGVCIERLYQEHAVVIGPPDIVQTIDIGQTLGVLPVHACWPWMPCGIGNGVLHS